MSDELYKPQPNESTPAGEQEIGGSTPVDETASAAMGGEPSASEQPAGEQTAGAEQSNGQEADDFRDALSNLSSALDRFGRAAETRARHEWEQGKPEINRALDEMKRGLEGLIRKSGGIFDSVSKRLNKDEEAGASGATSAEPTSPSGTGEAAESQHSPVDFPPVTPEDPSASSSSGNPDAPRTDGSL